MSGMWSRKGTNIFDAILTSNPKVNKNPKPGIQTTIAYSNISLWLENGDGRMLYGAEKHVY